MSVNVERSTLLIFLSSAVFFVSGYLIYFILGRFLGPSDFGVYSVVISLASLLAMLLAVGIEQSVSKFVSERPEEVDAIRNTTLKFQLAISTIFFAAYFMAAPYLAQVFQDPGLTVYFQASSFLLFVHPVFAVLSGVANGLKRFSVQAKLLVAYSTAKAGFVVGLALIGFGILGAVSGFIVASILGIVLYLFALGFKRASGSYPVKRIVGFALPVMGFAIIMNVMQDFGIFSVKALLDAAVSSELAGYYTVALTIAKVPYGLMLSLSLVFFPLISSATFKQDFEKAGFYIKNSLRYALLLIVPAVSLFAATAPQIIDLVYGAVYLPASQALVILMLSFALLSLFHLLTIYIMASNRPKTAFLIGLATIAVNIALNFVFVPEWGIEGAAYAVLGAVIFGFIVSAAYALARFRVLFNPISALRILFSGFVVWVIAFYFPFSGLALVLQYAVLFGLYLAILFVLRELTKFDLNLVLNVVRK